MFSYQKSGEVQVNSSVAENHQKPSSLVFKNYLLQIEIKTTVANKLTSWGIPSRVIAYFEPILVTKYPIKKLPSREPKNNIEPIQETSSTVNAPLANGLSADWSSGRAGESQPLPHPWLKVSKFAVWCNR